MINLTEEEYKIFLTKHKDFRRYLKTVIVPELARIEGMYIDDSRDYDLDWCFHEGCLEITLTYRHSSCHDYDYTEPFFKVRCEDLLRDDWEYFLREVAHQKNMAALKAKEEAAKKHKEDVEKSEREQLKRLLQKYGTIE